MYFVVGELLVSFFVEEMRFLNVLQVVVVLAQLGPWQYWAAPANTLGATESSACAWVRVKNFCQRSPFAMLFLTGLPKRLAQMEVTRLTDCVWAFFLYRWLGFSIVVSLTSKRFCLQWKWLVSQNVGEPILCISCLTSTASLSPSSRASKYFWRLWKFCFWRSVCEPRLSICNWILSSIKTLYGILD